MCPSTPSSSSVSISTVAFAGGRDMAVLLAGGGSGDGDGEGVAQQRLLAQAFAVLDRDGDGSIRAADLSVFFDKCVGQAISAEEADSMVSAADLDGDGAVDMREFLHILTPPSPSPSSSPFSNSSSRGSRSNSNALRGMFDVLDADGDGVVDEHDLRQAMDAMLGHPISDDDLHAMLTAAASPRAPSSPSSSSSSSQSSYTIDFDSFSMLVSSGVTP